MAQKLYEESNIQAIADAIREKNGETTTYKTSEMADAISAITTGGVDIPEEAFLVTGDCTYRFYRNGWNNLIQYCGNLITTKDITKAEEMFTDSSGIEQIPFKINFKDNTNVVLSYMFDNCSNLMELPEISTVRVSDIYYLLSGCRYIRNVDTFFNNFDYSYIKSSAVRCHGIFNNCFSLRSIPYELFKNICPTSVYNRAPFDRGFNCCFVLDEVIDLPLPYTATWTSNAFTYTFSSCCRLKEFTFETNDDGTPKIMNWKGQTIDLTTVGRASNSDQVSTQYNSGITKDKEVKDDATYQALKNDPDWFATHYQYSRYNHDSAVNTINSLPDTSAYLTTAGGTNTIKFFGSCGRNTDGGAIVTLTEEEIAVATAKGWTVTLV